VQIVTPVQQTDQAAYYQRTNGETVLLGHFDVYDLYGPLEFVWQPDAYERIDFAHASYRVALRQYFPWTWFWYEPEFEPDLIRDEEFQEIRAAHHWASNPNHTSFTIPLIYSEEGDWVCTTCPTRVVVQPERWAQYVDPLIGTYEYEYTPIPNAAEQWSEPFLIGGR